MVKRTNKCCPIVTFDNHDGQDSVNWKEWLKPPEATRARARGRVTSHKRRHHNNWLQVLSACEAKDPNTDVHLVNVSYLVDVLG